MNKEIIIDATGAVVGRLAAFSAKQALLGKEIKIVNCNEAVFTGRKEVVLEKFKAMRRRGGSSQRGPNFPRSPERILKRIIRGMLPYKKGRGSSALKNIKCYNSIPQELADAEKITLKRNLKAKATKLSKITEEL